MRFQSTWLRSGASVSFCSCAKDKRWEITEVVESAGCEEGVEVHAVWRFVRWVQNASTRLATYEGFASALLQLIEGSI